MNPNTIYLDTWKRFVKEGVLDSARLNKRILESWYRCKKEQVNPYLNKGLHVLTEEELLSKKDKNSLLLEIASPYLSQMEQAIKDSGMMTLLVDPDGYVLSLSGNEKTLMDANRINFVEGVRWTEAEVGTNAIGTAIQTKEPVIIHGVEHYSVASHYWSCSATPILDENRNLLGVIDVSCPLEKSHPLMFGMATSIAYAIEKDLNKRFFRKEISLIQQATELAEKRPNQLFVICNRQNVIIAASKAVRNKFPQVLGMNLQDLLHNRYQIDIRMPFLAREDNSINGSCIYLSEIVTYKPHQLLVEKPFIYKGECGTSEVFQTTLKKVKLVAPTDATVMITGETGSGKELIAQAIHDNSTRKNGPFVSINCGAIPKDLIESELFGYVGGAFTGARRHGYKGKFEQAHTGTIFLDEIGEIPHSMQVALLRVLQERKVTPIGSTNEVPFDVRVIVATHQDLVELVQQGDFREDLFYRLNVYPIAVPPLRKRKEDIPHLVEYICNRNNWNIPNIDQLSSRLKDYDWPGNIRELVNVLERLHIIAPEMESDQENFFQILGPIAVKEPSSTEQQVEEAEAKLKTREKIQRDLMLDALNKTKGNVTAAAKLIDIPRSTFYRKLQKFGL
ncbi:sigma-54-dependent Fis family transcriptional regulator [Neobacillus sp. LXY-4]|uniref:sigma-54-dependent Fis family transcriptional regulator n=1 Tax=Neobacillus sp. LXY-4 TaxID=3379826 RepID=UPI003EE2668B